jgi:hypothetical protein
MSDIFVGEISSVVGFVPRPTLLSGATTLPVRVDICGDAPTTLNGATVTLELSHPDAAPFARSPLTLTETDDERRRIASATLAIGSLPPGEYVITADLLAPSGAELTVSRQFVKR